MNERQQIIYMQVGMIKRASEKQEKDEEIRYQMRNEIEDIIKKCHIDRSKFHEVAKNYYDKVLCKLYYTFCDYIKYPSIQITYMWTRFRNDLKSTNIIRADRNTWEEYICKMDNLIPEKDFITTYYFIVDGGWVYEGELDEIKKVLLEYPVTMDDFYFFPKDYRWLIYHCEDGDCMCRVWN